MACARDGSFDTGIHSLETNDWLSNALTHQLMYSPSLFSPVPKRLVTITCSIQTPGGIVAKKPQHAQNSQRGQQGKQDQQQKRGGKAQGSRPTHASAAPSRPWRPGRDKFLPVSRADMDARGWDQCDFVYICGDAYVDHPSFGMAIVSRVLDAHGYKVGIICQPDWTDPASITVLGEPRLGFLVSAGNMDSMVNHYSVTKHRRHTDAYTPGGEEGHRPNRAVTVYGNLIRQTFKDAPIIIGGIEASLRRLAHYDYWQDKLKRSVLLASGADILIYGMGERLSRSPTRSTRGCPSIRSPISTAPFTARVRSTRSTTTTCCPAGTTLPLTSSTTPAALTCSSKIWTPSPGIVW